MGNITSTDGKNDGNVLQNLRQKMTDTSVENLDHSSTGGISAFYTISCGEKHVHGNIDPLSDDEKLRMESNIKDMFTIARMGEDKLICIYKSGFRLSEHSGYFDSIIEEFKKEFPDIEVKIHLNLDYGSKIGAEIFEKIEKPIRDLLDNLLNIPELNQSETDNADNITENKPQI